MTKKRRRITSFKFKPFSLKQKKLLMWWTDNSIHRNKDIVIAEGAIRSGKTVAMIDSFLTWSLAKHRNQNFIVAGKSMGALKRNVLEPMFKILAAKGMDYHYHRSENPHIIIGTNTYYLFGAANDASQDVLQGFTAAGLYLDEAALFPKSFVEQAIGRCSAETDGNGAKMFFNCNPAGPYHWFKTEYIDKAKEKNALILHFAMDDNLSLSEQVKERFRRMFTGVFYKRYILGLWVMAEGIIYDMFSDGRHRAKSSPIKKCSRFYVSIDYGTQNPTVFLLWGKYQNKWYCLKEYYYDGRKSEKQKTDQQYYDDLVQFIGDLPIYNVIVDPSAASFIAIIEDDDRFSVVKAKNDVLEGIRNTATCLSNDSILFDDGCINCFKEFNTYSWDPKATQRGQDAPLKENDHCMDAIRYFVNTVVLGNSEVKVKLMKGGL